MKKLIGIFIVTAFALTGCNNQQQQMETSDNNPVQADPKHEFVKLDEFLRKFDEPSQTFKEPTNKLIKVKGKQGTIIYINPSDLEAENGQPLGKDVEIELKELSNQQQLLRANAQTVSDGQLLVSGGACFINVTSAGQKVKLKEGKTYSVVFPKLSDDEMSLFYGQRDSTEKMNWKEADQKFVIEKSATDSSHTYETLIVMGKDTTRQTTNVNISEEERQKLLRDYKVSGRIYSPVELNQFGWINCDRFFKKGEIKTTLQFEITNKVEDVNYARVTLIFKDIKSIMQSGYYFYDGKIEGNTFENIPVGMKIKFLAVSYQHEKVFATLINEMQVKENHIEKISLQEMSEKEFDLLMKSIQ